MTALASSRHDTAWSIFLDWAEQSKRLAVVLRLSRSLVGLPAAARSSQGREAGEFSART